MTTSEARDIFLAALERQATDRAAYLDQACGGDADLRKRVQALLGAHDEPGAFLSEAKPDRNATSSVQPNSSLVGTMIAGRYKLLEQIGDGGMGTVWMAEQREPVKRLVAVKLIKPGMDSKGVLARFEAERQALALMDHPNIAKVLDGGTTEDGRPFFVMELVKGLPLTEYCDARRLSVNDRLDLFVQICSAVQHAHQKAVIHRDLKPSNLLVTEHDGKPVPKVIDFGLAKALNAASLLTERTLHTAFGTVVGTPLYMAPEQVGINALDVDTRTDIYALGVILYELLTGSTPLEKARFKEAAWEEVKRLIREEDPPRPSTRLSSDKTLPSLAASRQVEPAQLPRMVRGDLDLIVMKALEKDRSRRYETASGLAKDVERFLKDEAVEACPPSTWYRFRKMARRNKAAVTTAALVAATLLLGIVGTSFGLVEAVKSAAEAIAARDDAENQRNRAVAAEADARHNEEVAKMREREAAASAALAEKRQQFAQEQGQLALDQARIAQEERQRAERERRKAEKNEARAEWGLYAANIGSAQREWEAGNFRLFNDYLNQCRPDFRGWEHDFLYTTANPDHQLVLGPTSNVLNVVFSPDGKCVASAGHDKTVKVWDAQTGREKLKFKVYAGKALTGVALTFSPDGKHLATATFPANYAPQLGTFGEVTLWDTATGKPVQTFKGNPGPVTSLAFSPDGKLLLGGGFGGGRDLCDTIKLWETATGKEVLTINGEPNGTSPVKRISVAFSPDGRRFTSASFDGTVKVWELASGQVSLTLQQRGEPKQGAGGLASFVSFNPDGRRLLSSSFGGTVKVWDLTSGKALQTLQAKAGAFRVVAASPDGKLLATAVGDGKVVKVCDTATGGEVASFAGHAGSIKALAFSPNGKSIASGSWGFGLDANGELILWDIDKRQQLPLTFKGHTDYVQAVAFSPDGTLLASGAGAVAPLGFGLAFGKSEPRRESNGKLWNTATGQEVLTIRNDDAEAQISCLAFSPRGNLLASGSRTLANGLNAREPKSWGALKLWDARTGQLFRTAEWLTDGVNALAFSPDGNHLASAGSLIGRSPVGQLKLWDAGSGQEVRAFQGHDAPVLSVVFSPDGKMLASSAGREVKLWDVATGMQLLLITVRTGMVKRVAFSPDGKRLAGLDDKTVMLWDITSTPAVATQLKGHTDAVWSVVFSPDGKRLASGGGITDQTVRIWDTASGQELLVLKRHSSAVTDLAFSPDGKRLASASWDRTVILWDASKSMRELHPK